MAWSSTIAKLSCDVAGPSRRRISWAQSSKRLASKLRSPWRSAIWISIIPYVPNGSKRPAHAQKRIGRASIVEPCQSCGSLRGIGVFDAAMVDGREGLNQTILNGAELF